MPKAGGTGKTERKCCKSGSGGDRQGRRKAEKHKVGSMSSGLLEPAGFTGEQNKRLRRNQGGSQPEARTEEAKVDFSASPSNIISHTETSRIVQKHSRIHPFLPGLLDPSEMGLGPLQRRLPILIPTASCPLLSTVARYLAPAPHLHPLLSCPWAYLASPGLLQQASNSSALSGL